MAYFIMTVAYFIMTVGSIIFSSVAYTSAKESDQVIGEFSLPISKDVTALPLDPSTKSSLFKHEGDMTFIVVPGENKSDPTNHLHRKRRNAISGPYLWPGARIPYHIASIFDESERRVIFEAMRHWEEHTCIRFHPSGPQDLYRIYIMSAVRTYCASFVGRIFARSQGIALGPGCVTFSTIVHELGHAIGFYHEHNRPDRDDYVNVRVPINSYIRSQVSKLRFSNTLGLGYDYASIMHYSSLNGIITAKEPNIPIGDAEELSPLDIEKTNRLYSCGPREEHPPPSTPPLPPLDPPSDCGRVLVTDQNGSFQFPGYPSHRHNQDCTFVLRVPRGYGLDIYFTSLGLDASYLCLDEYVQFFVDSSVNPEKQVYLHNHAHNRICRQRNVGERFTIKYNIVTIQYHTDGSNAHRVNVKYVLRDINECTEVYNLCHGCTNHEGSYSCYCREGYYHSPAANICYDVNECAFDNGGCGHTCVNLGGSYTCLCDDDYFLQRDGLSCGRNEPAITPRPLTPGTIIPIGITQSTTPATPACGGVLTESSGSIQTHGWPDTAYPINVVCEWTIACPGANKLIDIEFNENFRLAGQMPDCPKDKVEITSCDDGDIHGPYCHLTAPQPITGLCNSTRIIFYAGTTERRPTRTGFSIDYRCVDKPTTQPPPSTRPTTPSPTTLPTTPEQTTDPVTNNQSSTDSVITDMCSLRSTIPISSGRHRLCSRWITSGTEFTYETFPESLPSNNVSCYYILGGAVDKSYQLRIRYLDFPKSATCDKLRLTVYEKLSTNSPKIEEICGDITLCSEFAFPIPSRSLLVFKKEGTLPDSPRGFIAVFEEVPV